MSTQVSNEKPTLNGVKIHARKRDAKAQAKYEPEEFRTSIFQVIEPIAKDDFAKISAALDNAGNTLDYRRYGDTFFEIFVTGGIIAPGGIIKDDDALGKLPFSLFVLAASDSEDLQAQISGAKIWSNLITRLTRRYKYLERIFAETTVHVIENIHRYSDVDNRMLAIGMGVLLSEGFLTMDPFRTLQKDHLTKDGIALRFMTDMVRVYLKSNSISQLNKLLNKARIRQLNDFFPIGKRDNDCFVRHFEAEDIPEVIELHNATQAVLQRDLFVIELVKIIREDNQNEKILASNGDASAKEGEGDDEDAQARNDGLNIKMATAAKKAMRRNKWEEQQVVVLVWDAIMALFDLPPKPDQIEAQLIAHLNRFSTVLEAFTASPKSEIALLKHVQSHYYNEPKLTRFFGRSVFELYSSDVLSDSAIIFWAAKGAKPEGKDDFLKQTEVLVKKLEALEGSDDEDESDDEE
ncbi:hypothetical protein GGI07_002298 [Coemansia sp. Benny D115]|nr:hypothetical protein GGI07_002298 [Coemansia sp. Benny D115]